MLGACAHSRRPVVSAAIGASRRAGALALTPARADLRQRSVALRALCTRWSLPARRFLASGAEGSGTGQDSKAPEEGLPPAGQPSGSSGERQALFVLPLYRKPAFPGFYHVVQIADAEILDFLQTLRRNGQGEYLAGFMTKELPQDLSDSSHSEASEPLVALPPSAAQAPEKAKNLRKDTGKVESADELLEIGTQLQVVSTAKHPSMPGGQIVVMPTQRIRRVATLSKPSPGSPLCAVDTEVVASVEVPENDSEATNDVRALHHEIIATMKDLLKMPFTYKEQFEQVIKYYNLDDPLKLADLVAGMSMAPRMDLQEVLVSDQAVDRLRKVLMIMKKDLESARLQSQFRSQIEDKFAKENRKYILMQQLRHIKRELNLERDDKQSIIAAFKEAISKLGDAVPEEASKAMEQELGRLNNLEPQSAEFNVSRTYLEWLTAVPWGKTTQDNADIERAETILNEDHYSLEDVKERILEHMAVTFLKGSIQGKIMCLVGPPGVGKTSIGKSVARALDRKFFRFSVGGLHDVSEIRGHRRTYVGAMPGKIIQAMKITQVCNPVILVDEVDKLGRDFRGDPSSALLEVLDPEQNANFRDHYLDVPVDLSKVLFLCTANVLDTIPGPLLDRMEVIRIAGYVYEEKLAIANQYLIPQTIATHGVDTEMIDLRPEALAELIRDYAREAGVRELRKLLEKIARKVALSLVRVEEEKRERSVIGLDNLRKFVGQPPHSSDQLFSDGTPCGVVMGLAWTALGGKTMFVEARGRVPFSPSDSRTEPSMLLEGSATGEQEESAKSKPVNRPGSGPRMKVTGKLGKVMGESSEIALTYSRVFLRELEPQNDFLDSASIHMNMPEGATPKDGPSAGVTMTSALLSLALDRPVKRDMAMSGEITLTGKVLRVGGIKEKALAARRENVSMLVLPMSNQADYLELKPYLRAGLTAHFVDHFDDVYRLAFEDCDAPMPSASRGSEVVTVFTPQEEGQLPPPLLKAGSTDAGPTDRV
eukprot:TRINITY_DN2450_c0_g2_i1.p1 TRINITY_DN2450_c0_g2~~TRINITY_DN2450_c0_g2_i1.p1  ORF type:complete len:994 (-),score=206.88 TRINITY_DN2450_c0_g2_i1:37-3018(-)